MKELRQRLAGSSVALVLVSLAVAGSALGCSRRAVPLTAPQPAVADTAARWPATLLEAQRLADNGHYTAAERLLADFAVQHAGSPEGAEADFWRALLRADPLNGAATVRDQLAALDTYLQGGSSQPRYLEAQILRRLVEQVDSLRSVVVGVRAAAQARERARGDEVRRLADELEKALAELVRIRRRLAPRPEDRKPPDPR
jgi:hypothetical protein